MVPSSAAWAGAIALLAGGVASTPALARFLLDTFAGTVPSLTRHVTSYCLLACMLILIAVINMRGARQGVVTTVVVTSAKFMPLALLTVIGLKALHSDALTLGPPPAPQKLEQANALLFFAFTGVEAGTYLSGAERRTDLSDMKMPADRTPSWSEAA